MNALDTNISGNERTPGTRPMAKRTTERQRPKSGWLAITGLLLLGTLPVIGGVLRLGEVGSGSETHLHWTSTVAIIAHIVAMTTFCLIGAFQFSPALRSRRSRRSRRSWHRTAGHVLIPSGIIAVLASMWLAVFFGGPPEEFVLAMVRLVFAVPMAAFLAMAVIAITRHHFDAHGAWMTRAFAIAVTGGTQALVTVLWTIPFGEVDASGEAWLVGAGFVINSVIAELLIRRRPGRSRRALPQRRAFGP